MTTVEFETATLSDVLKKAKTVAPPAGNRNAFDKAAGILLEITPDEDVKCLIRSTNLDVFFMEAVEVLNVTGEATTWRLPSELFTKTIEALPMGDGRTVKVADDPTMNRIVVTSAKLRAGMAKMEPDHYPDFAPSGHVTFTDVQNIGGRIAQAAWAAAKADPPLNGIHFTGTHILATDRYRVVRVACTVALPNPVTIPASVLSSLLKQTGDVQVGLDSTMMYFRPDDYSEIATITLGDNYPNLEAAVKTDYEGEVKINKNLFITQINHATTYAGADRSPLLRVFLGKGEIATVLGNETDIIRDVIEVPGYADHARLEIGFTPANLVAALNNAPNDTVTLKYDVTQATRALYIDGGSGWEGWVMARRTG